MKKYIGEALLIIFSVLFALFINKLFDDFQTRKKKHIALEGIKKELYRNARVMDAWKAQHTIIRDRTNTIV